MKIAIMKLGRNKISFAKGERITNGNMGEIEQIVKLFTNTDCDITICETKKSNAEDSVEHFGYHKIDHHSLLDGAPKVDVLVVIGGTTNFFGGADSTDALLMYKTINEFNGKILYFYTDPLCAPAKKIGHQKVKTDLDIPLEVTIQRPMHLLTCEKQYDPTKNPWKSKNVYKEWESVHHFEFSQSSIFNNRLESNFDNKDIDLVYGGFYRGGARRDQMIEYFFDTPYSARFFGGIKLDQFKFDQVPNKIPEFDPKKGGWSHFQEQTNRALATVIFGEKSYQDNIVTMRVYYSVLSGTVVFVDDTYDSSHKLFGDDMFYVKSKSDIENRIAAIKKMNMEQYKKLLDYQYSKLNIDKNEYYAKFKSILDVL